MGRPRRVVGRRLPRVGVTARSRIRVAKALALTVTGLVPSHEVRGHTTHKAAQTALLMRRAAGRTAVVALLRMRLLRGLARRREQARRQLSDQLAGDRILAATAAAVAAAASVRTASEERSSEAAEGIAAAATVTAAAVAAGTLAAHEHVHRH